MAFTKRDVVVRITEQTNVAQRTALRIVQLTLDAICEALANGEHVEFRDFGVFEVCTRKARLGRNPKKPEQTVQIPERRTVAFKPGKRLRDKLCVA